MKKVLASQQKGHNRCESCGHLDAHHRLHDRPLQACRLCECEHYQIKNDKKAAALTAKEET